ncbi:hypothetical protein EYF80_056845 [Liparis tanakae]|uniref:Uncharacterized protein n=1 Tax=Liparis tanakae TaxID=230148 RepID=A0A4Z2EXL4_9TELE|nr:hypothetical protein EYF80_056845 [Liparis tanakae]
MRALESSSNRVNTSPSSSPEASSEHTRGLLGPGGNERRRRRRRRRRRKRRRGKWLTKRDRLPASAPVRRGRHLVSSDSQSMSSEKGGALEEAKRPPALHRGASCCSCSPRAGSPDSNSGRHIDWKPPQ